MRAVLGTSPVHRVNQVNLAALMPNRLGFIPQSKKTSTILKAASGVIYRPPICFSTGTSPRWKSISSGK